MTNLKRWLLPVCAAAVLGMILGAGGCKKKSTGSDIQTITDIDGNEYIIVQIGNQWWTAGNLRVTHYRNGDAVPNVTDDTEWTTLTTGAYCIYDNDIANKDLHGCLYNFQAVADPRGLAPAGWHVATDGDWKELEMYLGMSQAEADGLNWRGTDEGGKLKSRGTTHWLSPNVGATNEYDFTVLPGGFRVPNTGEYAAMGYRVFFWTGTAYDAGNAWYRLLHHEYANIARGINENAHGFVVRCVRD